MYLHSCIEDIKKAYTHIHRKRYTKRDTLERSKEQKQNGIA